MKIYTRTGDNGSTGLFGGPRVSKDDSRIEAYGTVDELNAAIGVARVSGVGPLVDQHLTQVQHELFAIGAELATPDPERHGTRVIGDKHIRRLERWIDAHEESLPPLRSFVLPAGSPGACSLHLARAICRRAERRVIRLCRESGANVTEEVAVYLNRLSDLLFVLSRVANQESGTEEVAWVGLEGLGESD